MENAMAEKDLNELFLDTLKDIYYAEKQILKALPKMAKAANSDNLRTAGQGRARQEVRCHRGHS
jgi:ferritin-like metal-binding protein YciE